jgi:hypothetical protein
MTKRIGRAGGVVVAACVIVAGCGGGSAVVSLPPVDAGVGAPDVTVFRFDVGAPGHDATADTTLASDTGTGDAHAVVDSSHGADGGGDATAKDGASPSDAAHDHASTDAHGAGDGAEGSDAHSVVDGHAEAHADALSSQEDGATDASGDVAAPPPTFAAHCGGVSTKLTGTVYAPNGADVIPSVRVYAAKAINPYPAGYCDKCSAPIDAAYTAAYSAPNGTFTLDLDQVPYGADIEFTIQIGRFRKHTVLPVTACKSVAVPMAAETLPGSSAAGDIPRIVVSAGEADHLDVVLSALGITEYDCYEGRKTPGASTATCNQVAGKTIADVLVDAPTLDAYNMAFLSCAPGAYANYIKTYAQATMTANTQSWVAGGGRIFVTDTAYDYIAQAFPAAVTWEGKAGTPQPVDSANIGCAPAGPGGSSAHDVLYNVTIDDPTLAAWLGVEKVIPVGSTAAEVDGYYEPWSAIASLPMSSTLIADGTMPIDPTYSTTSCANPTMKDLPLTAEFAVPTCGRVVFSSYHTYNGTGAGSPAANEKIMEYLIFAAAVCGG